MKKSYYILVGFILLCLFVGFLGGTFTRQSVTTWYPTLVKPYGTPPPWVFGPVWTVLYVMMAIGAWLVWSEHRYNKTPLYLWGIQLGHNLLWSLLFFTFESPLLGMIDILFLWVALLATTISFYGVNRKAGLLMIPYLAWVTYATYLNIAIWWLN